MIPLLPLALALAAAAPDGAAAPPLPDPAPLMARLRAAKAAEAKAWLALGHYRRGPLGWKGEADGPAFYLSPRGQRDPAAELEATLAALLAAAPAAGDEEPVACRFPARRRFLLTRLGLGEADLPSPPCPAFDAFRARVRPVGATLVFSSYYLNNPASSFGHTLLRLDKAEARGTERAELLDYGVNFAATATTGNPVAYAVLGLLGGFKGEFSNVAYYYKVREYADAESRDLWEYDLDLAPDEVERLVAHLWELGHTWFDYWYLDENCSYHLLALLEAAAPRLDLLPRAGRFVVLPSDTVKALFQSPGLVRAVRYRPSILTQFRARLAPLSAPGLDAVERLDRDPAAPLPAVSAAEQALVLDAALDQVDLWAFKALALETDPAAARRRQVLLERRASLGVPSKPLELAPPLARAPQAGHGSFRVGAGGGASRAQGGLGVLEFRLALHDLADPPAGFPELAHIEFLQTRLRLAPRGLAVQADEAWALRVVSLNDLSRFDQRPSWRFKIGAETVRDAGTLPRLAFSASGGGGFATAGLLGVADLMASADVDVQASPGLAGLRGGGWRLGAGPSALLRLRPWERLSLLGEAGWRWLPEARPRTTWRADLEARLHLGRDLSLALRGRRQPGESLAEGVLYAYF